MGMVDSLQSTLDSVQQTKETVVATVDTLKTTAGGMKAVAMKMVNEAINKAKVEIELRVEFTKKLIPLYGQQVEYEAIVAGYQAAYDAANAAVQTAKSGLETAEQEYTSMCQLVASLKRKAQYDPSAISNADEEKLDKVKKTFEDAKKVFKKAEDAVASVKKDLDANVDILNGIKKEISKIQIQMNPASAVEALKSSVSMPSTDSLGGVNMDKDSGGSNSGDATQPAGDDSGLTQEEIEAAKEEGEKLKAAKEDEVKGRAPALDKINAEWMVVETGITILQSIAAPLMQASSLPAAVGTAAPNPAFNMAVAGSTGLVAAFVLCEVKASAMRWAALCQENDITPEPDKMAKIMMIPTLAPILMSGCGTGATYTASTISQLM